MKARRTASPKCALFNLVFRRARATIGCAPRGILPGLLSCTEEKILSFMWTDGEGKLECGCECEKDVETHDSERNLRCSAAPVSSWAHYLQLLNTRYSPAHGSPVQCINEGDIHKQQFVNGTDPKLTSDNINSLRKTDGFQPMFSADSVQF